ncbi:MAG TPA: DUF1573 domain-containing protein [Thermoanaerobaculia bacterium]|nr:DUF1573 domain-containing protein [Thermoanaerobaculia bacterium]
MTPPLSRSLAAAALAVACSLVAATTVAQPPAAPPGAPPAPSLVAPDPIFDAGAVSRGGKVVHEFTLQNRGVEVMRLREVRPGCGCTVASYDATIAPGGAGKVRVEVDTAAFTGAIAKEVTVFTSDPANPAIQLTVRAVVQAAVDAQPGYFRFLHVRGAPAESVQQVVWSADRPDLQVLGVESPLPSITVSFHPAAQADRVPGGAGRQWVVVATLTSEPPPGPLSGDVLIRTDHPRKPTLAVPIAGYVRTTLMATPPAQDLGGFPAGQPRRASVLITNYGAAPVQVLSVDTDVRGLTARVEEREKGRKFDIALTLAADLPKGPFSGALRVRTDSPQQPLLEIPVKGEVR